MPYGVTYMWNLKHDTDELMCPVKQKQTHIQRRDLRGWGDRNRLRTWDVQMQSIIYA